MIHIAKKLSTPSYQALITGENLGQVASQTIQNIAVINKVGNFPILRPLISFYKQEIIDRTEKIDTFEFLNVLMKIVVVYSLLKIQRQKPKKKKFQKQKNYCQQKYLLLKR